MSTRDRCFFLIVVVFCLWVLQPLWLPLAVGMILAFLSEGPVNRILKRYKIESKRGIVGVSLAFVLFAQTIFIAPVLLLGWSAAHEFVNFWNYVNGDSSTAETGQKVLDWLNRFISPWIQKTGFDLNFSDISARIQQGIEPTLKNLALSLGNLLSATPDLLLFLIVAWMAWFYFLVHGHKQRAWLLPALIPWEKERRILRDTMAEVLRAMVLTSVVLSVIQTVIVIATLGFAGIPKFMLWGACAFFLSFVPIFGTAPVMLSAAIYCFVQDRTVVGVVILGMAVFIGSIDNIIRPFLMKGSTELSFFWLFMALVGGIAVFGIAGAILGPWAFAVFSSIREDLKRSHAETSGEGLIITSNS